MKVSKLNVEGNYLAHLYRYESAEPFYHHYNENVVTKSRCRYGFGFLCGLLLTLFLVTYLVVVNLSQNDPFEIGEEKSMMDVNIFDTDFEIEAPAVVEEVSNEKDFEQNSMVDERNSTELDISGNLSIAVEPQKLVFLPSRNLQPPRRDVKLKASRKTDKPIRRFQPPRQFSHLMPSVVHPYPFKRVSTTKATSIRDQEGFNSYFSGMQEGFRPVLGLYRKPKGTFSNMMLAPSASTVHIDTAPFVSNSFKNFKPPEASDINLLVMDQPNKDLHLKLYNEQYMKNAHTLYQQIVSASRQKLLNLKRNGHSKHRPFKLMLDVYPMPEDENPGATNYPYRNFPKNISSNIRYNPYAAKLNAFNSINQEKIYSGSEFNKIRFAQTQGRNPYGPYYENSHMWRVGGNGKYINDNLQAAETVTSAVKNSNAPSQLVVHLNLYPKKKGVRGIKRPSSMVEEFNEDDDDDNTSDYFRRSSIEPTVMQSKKYTGASRYKKTKIEENNTETSSPISINFNFPSPSETSLGKDDCLDKENENNKRKIQMMDANDNEVRPAKIREFPYRFVSTPHTYLKPRKPIRPYEFAKRILHTSNPVTEKDNFQTTMLTLTETSTTIYDNIGNDYK